MIYQWRYPNSVDRSVMIGVNPPGNFIYSGAEIDQGIERYSALCAKQPACRARTANLAASMKHTAAHMPSSWFSLPIKPGNALVGTFLGLTEANSNSGSPLSGPMTLDSWISAAQGDPSGLWLLSWMADVVLPQSFTWGEFASIGMADAQPVERYFSSGADRGSIIGNPLGEFLWGAGGMAHAWPANPGENQYTSVQNSSVPTLLIGGTLDFETPAQNATKELLPHLSNGHQVILSGLGHVDDFDSYEPSASTQLLTTFYATGRVDTSRYTPNVVSFTTPQSQTAIAKDILGSMIGFALLAVIWLVVLAIRIRRRGGTGRKTGAWIRSAGPIVFGLGGWFLGELLVLRFWPSRALDDQLLAVVSIAVPIWLGVYAGWVRTDTPKAMRAKGIGAAGVGAVVGAALGFHVTSGLMALITTIIGAAVVSNLSLLVLDIWTERAASRGTAAPPGKPPTRSRGGSVGDGAPGAGPALIARTVSGNPWRIPRHARVMASDARAYKHVFVAGNATILHADLDACYASVEQRDDPLERSRGVQPRRRAPRPAHMHALSADAPQRGLTRRDCGRLRLNQTRRPRPARTDRVERPRDSPIRAERRVPITRRTRRFACPSRAGRPDLGPAIGRTYSRLTRGNINRSRCPLVPGMELLNHASTWNGTGCLKTWPYHVARHPSRTTSPEAFAPGDESLIL